MDEAADSSLAQAIAGAIGWWREAGVDFCFDDEPAQWISPAQPTAREAERLRGELREAPGRSGPDPRPDPVDRSGRPLPATGETRADAVDLGAFPADLAIFPQWWLGEPSLDGGRSGGRIAPRGASQAALMVIVAEPERDDTDTLLAGPQGRLLTAILAAMNLPQDQVYVASALPRHMPMPDWGDLAARGLGKVLARHVALAAPQRLIGFGDGVLSLLGHDLPNSAANAGFFQHDDLRIPLFRARGLEALLARPAWKAELWRGLLDWTAGASG